MNLLLSKQTLDRLLLSHNVVDNLEGLQTGGTLLVMFPEIQAMVGFGGESEGHKDLWGHTKQVVSQCVPKANVRWAALFHDVGKVKCFRRIGGTVSFHGHEAVSAKLFKRASERTNIFSQDDFRAIHFLIYHLGHVEAYEPDWTDSAVRRVYRHTKDYFDDLTALARADVTTKHANKRQQHHERVKELHDRAMELARLDAIPPALPKGLGQILSQEFNIPPSKALGDLMTKLKDAVEDGRLGRQPSAEQVLDFVRQNGLV